MNERPATSDQRQSDSNGHIFPDYNGGSIVNLMASIAQAKGATTGYVQARDLPAEELAAYKNIVLVVWDGLGYDYLLEKGQGTILAENLRGSLTSVFPSTTACAVASFATGQAPQQHAITGWFVYLRELDLVSTLLLFNPRVGGAPFSASGTDAAKILALQPLVDRLEAETHLIGPRKIMKSDFTGNSGGGSQRHGYSGSNEFSRCILAAAGGEAASKYIYAYWPEFDHISHGKGNASAAAERHFAEFAATLRTLAGELAGSGTALIVTSDHGFVDTTPATNLALEDYPEITATLRLPLCGEGRIPYCYVKDGRQDDFLAAVKRSLPQGCEVRPREELLRQGVFGQGEVNPEFLHRVGDYVIIMSENYILRDTLPGERKSRIIGRHGGISRAEMLVPLVVVEC